MLPDRDTRDWEELAELDPYWAALTEDSQRFGEWSVSEFAASGEEEIEGLLAHAAALGRPARYEAALDFGCGPGRLTRALAARFRSVEGVDLSKRMVEKAREMNREVENIRFAAGRQVLDEFEDRTFDLVYSNLVLQHVSDQDLVIGYVEHFVRILRVGGLVAFQLPSYLPWRRRLQPRRRLYHVLRQLGVSPAFLYRRLRLDPISLHAVPVGVVVSAIERSGGRLIRVDETKGTRGVVSATYFATRTPRPGT